MQLTGQARTQEPSEQQDWMTTWGNGVDYLVRGSWDGDAPPRVRDPGRGNADQWVAEAGALR